MSIFKKSNINKRRLKGRYTKDQIEFLNSIEVKPVRGGSNFLSMIIKGGIIVGILFSIGFALQVTVSEQIMDSLNPIKKGGMADVRNKNAQPKPTIVKPNESI